MSAKSIVLNLAAGAAGSGLVGAVQSAIPATNTPVFAPAALLGLAFLASKVRMARPVAAALMGAAGSKAFDAINYYRMVGLPSAAADAGAVHYVARQEQLPMGAAPTVDVGAVRRVRAVR